MERRSAPFLSFTLRIKASWLHRLCQALVERAYMAGHEDGRKGSPLDSSRVRIDPSQIRKFSND